MEYYFDQISSSLYTGVKEVKLEGRVGLLAWTVIYLFLD